MPCSSCKESTSGCGGSNNKTCLCQELRNNSSSSSGACCPPRCDFTFEQTLRAVGTPATGCFPAVASPSQPDTDFGYALAMSADGTVLVVGVPKFDVKASPSTLVDAGAVFVFERRVSFAACANSTDGKFTLVQILEPSDPEGAVGRNLSGAFGSTVAISGNGDRIAVGAPNQNVGSLSIDQNDGAVYIFDRKGKNKHGCGPHLWKQVQKVVAQRRTSTLDCTVVRDDQNHIGFGLAIALSQKANVLVVGDYLFASGDTDNGFVYIYEDCSPPFATSPCSFTCNPFQFRQRIDQAQVVKDANNPEITLSTLQKIGNSVATNGDGSIVAFGAVFASVSTVAGSGRAFIYENTRNQSDFGVVRAWVYTQNLDAGNKNGPMGADFSIGMALTPSGHYFAVESGQGLSPSFSHGFVTVYRRQCVNGCLQYVQDGNDLLPLPPNEINDSIVSQRSLAISDDGCVVAVGFEFSNVSTSPNAGDVAIFDRTVQVVNGSCVTVWVRRPKLLSEIPPRSGALFGSAVAMDAFATTLAVGASFLTSPGDPDLVTVFSSSFKPRNCK